MKIENQSEATNNEFSENGMKRKLFDITEH